MSILSEVAEIRDNVTPMSVEFYHASSDLRWIDESVELLRGIPVQKISKSPLHEYLVRSLLRLIEAVLPEGCFVTKESPLTTNDSEPEPDLMVVHGQESDFRTAHPTTAELVIEVALNTEQRDRVKAAIYAEARVSEYWIVLPEKQQIQIFSQSNGTEYQRQDIITAGEAVSAVIEGFIVRLPDFFS